MTLGSWGVPGGACGVLIQCKMVHCSAKGGMQVLMDAHGVLVQHAMVHCLARGRSFSQGEGGGEVSDQGERENAVEPLNKLSCVQEHLLPNAAVFNMARDLVKFFWSDHMT